MISCTSPSDSAYGLPISRVTRAASVSLFGFDEPPDLRDDATAHRRRNGGPVQLRRTRQPAGGDESVAVRGVDLGDDIVEVSRVAGNDAGGRQRGRGRR